jgi:hypothetical protein
VFLPESLRRLVPSPRRGGALVAAAWKPLLLARRALADHRHIVGAAHLTAAFTATEVRRLLLAALRPRGLEHRVPAWGSRPLAEEEARELHGFLQRDDDDGIAGVTHLSSTPWPSDWGGPDTHAIVSTLSRLIGSEPLAREAFLHDGLALSAIHVLSGNATNAMAALGTSRTPPAFDEARTALARVIHGGVSSSTLPVDRPSGPEVDAIHRQLREMPDPSLALETPYWLLGAQRAEAQYILQASGRLQDFRRLRLVLERPDVATSLAPFWLLGERPEVEKWLVDLVRRTAMQLAPPTPDECRLFLRSLE